MDHPLVSLENDEAKALRKSICELIDASKWVKHSNIIFVCGGTKAYHMRHKFKEYAAEHLPEYRVIFPENALEFDLAQQGARYTDLTRLEHLLAELSHCVLIFPEAPGSFAELGWFSGLPEVAKKTFIVLDRAYLGVDSFVLQGPVAQIHKVSVFRPHLDVTYFKEVVGGDNIEPEFGPVKNKFKDRKGGTRRHFNEDFKDWAKTPSFIKMAILFSLVHLCRLSTLDSLWFMTKALYAPPISRDEVAELCSVLLGGGFCTQKTTDNGDWIIPTNDVDLYVDLQDEKKEMLLLGRLMQFYMEHPEFDDELQEVYL